MTDDMKNLDDLPSITPDAADVSSYRRGGRSEAPKQSNFNGILVFIVVLMLLVMGFGGYVLFQVQNKLNEANELLSKSQASIGELEARLAATGSDVSKTFETMQEQSNTNLSEIDKLWAGAYRQNRPKIDKVAEDLDAAITGFKAALDPIAGAVSGVGGKIDGLNKDLITLKQQRAMDSEDLATELALIRQQNQDQSDALETLRRAGTLMAKQISEAKEDIGSNQNYRKQHNLQVIGIKKRIQKLEDAIIAPIIPLAP
jgi:chromosome segregation ATPase